MTAPGWDMFSTRGLYQAWGQPKGGTQQGQGLRVKAGGRQVWEGQGRGFWALVLARLSSAGMGQEQGEPGEGRGVRPMKEATEVDKAARRASWVQVLPREQRGARKSSRTAR